MHLQQCSACRRSLCMHFSILTILYRTAHAAAINLSTNRPANEVIIGGLGPKGEDELLQRYEATLSTYLTETVGPEFGVTFKLVYLNFSSNFDAVENRQVDLVLTNPSVFACLEREFRAHAVLSLRKLRKVGDVVYELNRFYGAFIVRANSSITKISEVEGKILEGVSLTGLGACQLQWDELTNRGIQFLSAPKQVRFSSDQTKTVRSVLAGEVDVGLVRTDIVEGMVSDGLVEEGSIRVLENLQGNPNDPDFPFAHSTTLAAPEFVLAGLPWTDWRLTRAILVALALIQPSHPAALAGQYAGWEAPQSSFGMHEMHDKLDRIDGNNRCLREGDVCETVVCPQGQLRKSCEQIKSGCSRAGLSCPEGYVCLCDPCETIDEEAVVVRPMRVQSFGLNGKQYNVSVADEFGDGVRRCGKLTNCITLQRSDLLTIQVDDNWMAYRESLDVPVIEAVEYVWDLTFSEGQVWQPAAHASLNYFTMDLKAEDLGSNLLRVRTCAASVCTEHEKSPFVILVVEKICPPTREPRPQDAECVCAAGYRETLDASQECQLATPGDDGPWLLIGLILASVFLLLGLLAGAWLVHKMSSQNGDESWKIQPEDLHFPEPRVVLGRGTYGQVLKAEFRNTEVAVKRVLPKIKPNASGGILPHRALGMPKKAAPEIQNKLPSFEQQTEEVMVYTNKRGSTDASTPSGDQGVSTGAVTVDIPDKLSGSRFFRVMQAIRSFDKPRATDMHLLRADSVPMKGVYTIAHMIKLALGPEKDGTDGNKVIQINGIQYDSNRTSSSSLITANTLKALNQQFLIEMKMMVYLRHPHILTVMGAVVSKGTDYLMVTELMKHGSLYDLMHDNHTMQFDSEIVMGIVEGIVSGMLYLHSSTPPILHNDLKTANILIGNNFSAKISDFGLCMKKKSTGFLGTAFWMAPELLNKGASPSPKTDVFSFGVTLFEIFTRQEPYEEYQDVQDVVEMLGDYTMDPPLRPTLPEGLPAAVSELICMCWDPVPSKRPSFEVIKTLVAEFNLKELDEWFAKGRHVTHSGVRTANQLLYDVFPSHIAKTLREGKKVEPQQHECVTIFFSDIVGFTDISHKLQPMEVMDMLDRLYDKFDALARRHDVFKVETIGDAYMAVANLVKDQPNHTEHISRFALDAIKTANETWIKLDEPQLGHVNIRVGFHCGPVVASVVGNMNPRFCLFGDTVNTSSRMESHSEKNKIHLTEVAATCLMDQAPNARLVCRGVIPIKGKGEMRTYWLEGFGAEE